MISVIVVSYNSWPYVGSCIASLYDHPPTVSPFEVILIDNASSDGTVEHVDATFPQVRVIASQSNDGYGVAVNRAMKHATGDHLVFLNPDCEITPGSLDTMVHLLDASAQVGVVGPRLVLPNGETQPSGRRFPSPSKVLLEVLRLHKLRSANWRADHLLGTYWDQSTTRRVDWVSGACHVLSRQVWDKVGPLTEKTFCGFDDFEYCFRAAELGLATWLCAEATVVHHVGTSVSSRWEPAEVDEMAIHNMFVVLVDLWPRWRMELLALSEAAAAASDCLTGTIRRHSSGDLDDRRSTLRRRARQLALLLGIAGGRPPIYRCEPGTNARQTASPVVHSQLP